MTVANGQAIATEHPYQAVLDMVLECIGRPETDLQEAVLKAYDEGDYASTKALALREPGDAYCKTLELLISVKAKPNNPAIATLMREVAAAASKTVHDKTLEYLGFSMSIALSSQD